MKRSLPPSLETTPVASESSNSTLATTRRRTKQKMTAKTTASLAASLPSSKKRQRTLSQPSAMASSSRCSNFTVQGLTTELTSFSSVINESVANKENQNTLSLDQTAGQWIKKDPGVQQSVSVDSPFETPVNSPSHMQAKNMVPNHKRRFSLDQDTMESQVDDAGVDGVDDGKALLTCDESLEEISPQQSTVNSPGKEELHDSLITSSRNTSNNNSSTSVSPETVDQQVHEKPTPPESLSSLASSKPPILPTPEESPKSKLPGTLSSSLNSCAEPATMSYSNTLFATTNSSFKSMDAHHHNSHSQSSFFDASGEVNMGFQAGLKSAFIGVPSATDGLCYNPNMSSDTLFLSPKAFDRRSLKCEETLESPIYPGFKTFRATTINSPRNMVNFLEPIRSSPMGAFLPPPSNTSAVMYPHYQLNFEKPEKKNEPDFEMDRPVEVGTDFTKYFRIETEKDAENPAAPERKYLAFDCQTLDIPVSRDGLASPYENTSSCMHTPESPLTDGEILANLPKEFEEEGNLRREMWMVWRDCAKDYLPCPLLLINHQLTATHRCVVVNWMMEVSMELKLHRQTFQSALNYFDRFYSKTKNMSPNLLQVMSAAALNIAAKKEEIEPPHITRMMELCSEPRLTQAQFSSIEMKMIQILGWELTPPTWFDWLCMYLRVAAFAFPQYFAVKKTITPRGWDKSHNFPEPSFRLDIFRTANMLIDYMLHKKEALQSSPSAISASAFYVAAMDHLRGDMCDEERESILRKCTGFTMSDICSCIEDMRDLSLRRDTLPGPGHPEEYRGRPDVELYQPEYHDLCQYLNDAQDYVSVHVDHDIGLSCLGYD